MKKYRFSTLAAVILLVLTATALRALAATDYFILLDWATNTYAPLSYTNKAKTMPINGSTITVYANIFSVAKKTTISQYQRISPDTYDFSWYVNNKKLGSGPGMDTFQYTVPRGILMSQVVIRVEISGKTEIVGSKSLSIPLLSKPEIKILREQNNKIIPLSVSSVTSGKGTTIKLIPMPYFFNVGNPLQLSFLWYQGKKKLPSSSYEAGAFEIKLPEYEANDRFKSVIYNNSFDLELGQQEIGITSK